MLNYENYKNTLPHPISPDKPVKPIPLNSKATSQDVKIHIEMLEAYEKALKAYEETSLKNYKEEKEAYEKEKYRLQALFKKDAIEESGLEGHPKAEKAFTLAYREGHSGGYFDVYYYLTIFAELLLD